MDFKVVALDSFKIVGKKANFSTVNGENFQEIPKMWEAANASGLDGGISESEQWSNRGNSRCM